MLYIVFNKVFDSYGDGLSDYVFYGERLVEDCVVCVFWNMVMVLDVVKVFIGEEVFIVKIC